MRLRNSFVLLAVVVFLRCLLSAQIFLGRICGAIGMLVNPSQVMEKVLCTMAMVALFARYLRQSKTVNVTYLHCVPIAAEGNSGEIKN